MKLAHAPLDRPTLLGGNAAMVISMATRIAAIPAAGLLLCAQGAWAGDSCVPNDQWNSKNWTRLCLFRSQDSQSPKSAYGRDAIGEGAAVGLQKKSAIGQAVSDFFSERNVFVKRFIAPASIGTELGVDLGTAAAEADKEHDAAEEQLRQACNGDGGCEAKLMQGHQLRAVQKMPDVAAKFGEKQVPKVKDYLVLESIDEIGDIVESAERSHAARKLRAPIEDGYKSGTAMDGFRKAEQSATEASLRSTARAVDMVEQATQIIQNAEQIREAREAKDAYERRQRQQQRQQQTQGPVRTGQQGALKTFGESGLSRSSGGGSSGEYCNSCTTDD